ncbi:MAG: glycoside hydrolase [Verrucomicrobiia bacterium]
MKQTKNRRLVRLLWTVWSILVFFLPDRVAWPAEAAVTEREIPLAQIGAKPVSFKGEVTDAGEFTWWLPSGGDTMVLPVADGIVVDTANAELMQWLRKGSPWGLAQLPTFGIRYGSRMLVVIVPWPHYAELVVNGRVGVKFSWRRNRENAAPLEVVALWRGADPLEVAQAFRDWRETAENTGSIPRPRRLADKAAQLPRVSWLYGAPHIYLWGSALFSRHDVVPSKWIECAKSLRDAPADSPKGRVVARFTKEQREALGTLAGSDWPMPYVTTEVAAGVERVLTDPTLLPLAADSPLTNVVPRNREFIASELKGFVQDSAMWGDGPSLSMLEALRDSGIDRALLLLSDLYAHSPRPDVAARATQMGFLFGPYDSYHSVHSPDAAPDDTWETSQFDRAAYEQGRVLNADGTGRQGFRGTGYQFSPIAAWPYVQKRVGALSSQVPYSAWFVDCDATSEWFDDYNPLHVANRVDDLNARRNRLRWLVQERKMVVGSEEGSALVADLVHFGHGVHTPYIGHLDPAFRDRGSPHFLGRHWPPDTPENMFKPVPVAPSLVVPYFDPRVRIPLYEAALGDELIVTHHWSFDSLKFSDLTVTRELLEILYMVPPMYHLNREAWPKRRDQIVRHVAFWGPIHRQLATARLTRFEWLSADYLLQRTTFRSSAGDVTITVNFGGREQAGYPPHSATLAGDLRVAQTVYHSQRE